MVACGMACGWLLNLSNEAWKAVNNVAIILLLAIYAF